MSMSARFISTVLTLVLGFSLSVGQASAQAMVSYGHGVAKAAGAGAAVGAGVGGALTGLGNPLSTAAGRRGGPSKSKAAVQRLTVPTRRGSVAWDAPQQGFGGPPPMALVGGVQANGGTDAHRQLTLLEPSQNLAVISASWGVPSAAQSVEFGEVFPTEELPANPEAETTAGAKQKLPIVLRSTGKRNSPGAKSAQQVGAAAPDTLPEGVAVGASVEQLLEQLSRPYLSFRGVAGEGYNDQYVFQLSDGTHLVVYVLDGLVTHMAVG